MATHPLKLRFQQKVGPWDNLTFDLADTPWVDLAESPADDIADGTQVDLPDIRKVHLSAGSEDDRSDGPRVDNRPHTGFASDLNG